MPLVLCCKLFTWYMYQHLPVGTCINTYLYKILLSFWQIKWMPPHLGTKSTNMHISLIWKLIIEIHFKHPTIEELIHSSFQFKSIEIKSYIKENQYRSPSQCNGELIFKKILYVSGPDWRSNWPNSQRCEQISNTLDS